MPRQAVMFFYKRHLCRVWPFPPDAQATLDWLAKDDTVYMTMYVLFVHASPPYYHFQSSIADARSGTALPNSPSSAT